MSNTKQVNGYEGLYSVDDTGEVWIHRMRAYAKPQNNGKGYLYIFLSKDSHKEHRYIHRLVLEAFVGPCPDGMECCHKDGNPSNNHASNLEWGTHQHNMTGYGGFHLQGKGEDNQSAKLTTKTVLMIRRKAATTNLTHREIAEIFGTTRRNASRIIQRKRWTHV